MGITLATSNGIWHQDWPGLRSMGSEVKRKNWSWSVFTVYKNHQQQFLQFLQVLQNDGLGKDWAVKRRTLFLLLSLRKNIRVSIRELPCSHKIRRVFRGGAGNQSVFMGVTLTCSQSPSVWTTDLTARQDWSSASVKCVLPQSGMTLKSPSGVKNNSRKFGIFHACTWIIAFLW